MNKKSEPTEDKDRNINISYQEKVDQNLRLLLTPEKLKPKEEKTTQKSESKFHLMKIDVPSLDLQEKDTYKYTGCNCKKSQCLKMYCVCFSFGKMCDGTCLCESCLNKTDNLTRSEAINQIITKDPFAFSKAGNSKLQSLSGGCNCKRSNCTKKYCECLKKGKRCGKTCNCVDCENIKKEDLGSPKKRVKLQQN